VNASGCVILLIISNLIQFGKEQELQAIPNFLFKNYVIIWDRPYIAFITVSKKWGAS
jgi:hypothetical protein